MSTNTWEDPSLAALFPASLSEIPAPLRVDPARNGPRLLLAGRIVESGRASEVRSKVSLRSGEGISLGYTPEVDAETARQAVTAAERAWEEPNEAATWRRASVETRIEAVLHLAEELEALTDPIAVSLMYEIGKPWPDARKEVTRSVAYIRETVRELGAMLSERGRVYSGKIDTSEHFARDVLRPSGVTLCVGPFNYPINEFLTTLVPALLVGNSVIGKIPRFGVLANQLLLDAFARCFPPGVVSVLPGDGRAVIPAVMAAHRLDPFGRPLPSVRTLAFIGSEGAAAAIVAAHPAPNFLTRILGLGAKNPAIVLPGASLSDGAVAKLVKGALGNSGQRCTAEKLFFLPEGPEGDVLVERISARVSAMGVGMPWQEGVSIAPLPEDNKPAAMQALIEDALSRGARLVNTGGGRHFGAFMRPAVVDGITDGMRLDHEEQFGPILAIRRYSDPLELLAWASRSPFGQQACIWGPDSPARRALIEGMLDEVARLNLDDVCQRGPDTFGFTATEKSGFGTLSLREALLAFSRSAILQSPDPSALRVPV